MLKNIGAILKALSYIIIAIVAVAILLIVGTSPPEELLAITATAIIGCFGALLSALLLYAFGDIADRVGVLNEQNDMIIEQNRLIIDALIALNNKPTIIDQNERPQ